MRLAPRSDAVVGLRTGGGPPKPPSTRNSSVWRKLHSARPVTAKPHAGRRQRDGKRRQHRERPLVEEGEVCGIDRITPETDPERVQDRVAPGVVLARLAEIMRQQRVGIDRHGQTGSHVNTSADRCSG